MVDSRKRRSLDKVLESRMPVFLTLQSYYLQASGVASQPGVLAALKLNSLMFEVAA
jgi:hypothetical protein